MDDDIEEYLSRPAKRRRISHQGELSPLSGQSPDNLRTPKQNCSSQLLSTSPTSPTLYTCKRTTSQANANDGQDEEMVIVDTSDNEELLLEDAYDDLDEDATTVFARSSPQPCSSLPTSSPSHISRISINSSPFRTETSASQGIAGPSVSFFLAPHLAIDRVLDVVH